MPLPYTMGSVGQADPALDTGGGLAGAGISVENESNSDLQFAAASESNRDFENKRIEMQNKQGNQQLGAAAGGLAGAAAGAEAGGESGSALGPWGMAIGAIAGGLIGGLFKVLGWLVISLVVSLCIFHRTEAAMSDIAKVAPITQCELHQILAYDPDTGIFTWLDAGRNNRVKNGDRAGYPHHKGYRMIKLGRRAQAEHRLAWLYMTGEWPPAEIDHIDRDRANNRFSNFRLATRKQNKENQDAYASSKSGFRGVHYAAQDRKWVAQICHFGKNIVIGRFVDIAEAKAARLEAEAKLFTHSTRVDSA